MPRPEQMNINVATWGRLLKKNNWAKPDINNQETRQEQDSFAGEYLLNISNVKCPSSKSS